MRNQGYVILFIAAISLFALGISAFAHSGKGMGLSSGRGHHGQGWHHGTGHGPGYHDQMTKEEYMQFEQKREAFFKETQEIRANLFEKERDLQTELAKDEPDAAKASKLQKEISELQAQFDQKRINHMIEMRKLNPNIGRGYMRGGPMMGYGHHGGGYCWR
jgi:Spy/CpxP family protein refolding chaperone